MTHRHYIAEQHRLAPKLVSMLQPFYSIDVDRVLIRLGVFDGADAHFNYREQVIEFKARVWWSYPPANLLASLCHELGHADIYGRSSWPGIYWDYVATIARSLWASPQRLLHPSQWWQRRYSVNEYEAQGYKLRVFAALTQQQQGVLDMEM